jgi:sec-independent protein translocase protein TatA
MVILLLVVVLLFGRGKISDVMGDVAKGIKSFKKGMSDDDAAEEARTVEHRADEAMKSAKEKASKS